MGRPARPSYCCNSLSVNSRVMGQDHNVKVAWPQRQGAAPRSTVRHTRKNADFYFIATGVSIEGVLLRPARPAGGRALSEPHLHPSLQHVKESMENIFKVSSGSHSTSIAGAI